MFRENNLLNSILRIAIGLMIFAALLSTTQAGDWPMFRHDLNHTGVSDEVVKPPLKLLWKYNSSFKIESSPAVSGGTVYVGSESKNLTAMDALTGKPKWNYTTGDFIGSPPAVSNGTVYFGSWDNNLSAIDENGSFKWKFPTGGIYGIAFSGPAVSNGVVYVGSYDFNLYAIYENGTKKWNFSTGGYIPSSPAVTNGVIYVASYDKNVYAIDAATGAKIWNFTTGSGIESSPAISGGVVYIGSRDNNIYAIDAATGAKIWNFTTGNIIPSSPAISGGVIYVGSYDNKVYAINASNGSEKWNFTTNGFVEASPAISDGVVYVGSMDKKFYAIDAESGKELWNETLGGSITSSAAISGGVVYVGSWDGNLYAFAQSNTIYDCTVIPIPGEYVLMQDIANSANGTCIDITSSDVIFDGNGHMVDGVDGTNTYGVQVNIPNSTGPQTNVTVKNLLVTDWDYGIYYLNNSNGNLINNIGNSNSWVFTLESSYNINVTDNIATNSGLGIILENSSNNKITRNIGNLSNTSISFYKSDNNTLIDNIADSNAFGVSFVYSSNNTLTGNNENSNYYGIVLTGSSNNTLSGNNASNNAYGIFLVGSSNNTLSGNNASNNTDGIYLSSSSNNLIYNNVFNNTNNFLSLSGSDIWNTTRTQGTNIIGGGYIGGNFWATPVGSGFSQTCTDADGDGICNSAYVLDANNTDYLPLSVAGMPSSIHIPPAPSMTGSTQGNFWINHTWQRGLGNITDSYNVSVNGTWTSGSANTYSNSTIGPHGWSNISVYAYNISGGGSLSPTFASQNIQVNNNVPVQAHIGDKIVTAGTLLTFTVSAVDADSDAMTYGTNATKGTLDPVSGLYSWTPNSSDVGTYSLEFASSDNYGGRNSTIITVIVKPPGEPPGIIGVSPENNSSNTTGYVNVTVTLDRQGMAFLNWDGVNESMDGGNQSYYKNKTVFESGRHSFKVFANVSSEFYNVSETRLLNVEYQIIENLPRNDSTGNTTKDIIIIAPSNNSVVTIYGNTNITIYNSTNASIDCGQETNVSIGSWYNLPSEIPTLKNYIEFYGENLSAELRCTNFLPDNAQIGFIPDAQIQFNYTDQQLEALGITDETKLTVWYFNNETEKWENVLESNIKRYPEDNYTIVNTSHFTFFVLAVPSLSSVTSDGYTSYTSGGGESTGGKGVSTKEPPDNIQMYETRSNNVVEEVATTYKFNPQKYGIYEIVITGKKRESDMAIRVELLKGLSRLVKDPAPEIPNFYTNVWGEIENIKESVFRFRVEKSWMATNNIKNVKMLKWDGSNWAELETIELKKDDTYLYLEARSRSLSQLAVVGVKTEVPPVVRESATALPTIPSTVAPTEVIEKEPLKINLNYILAVFVIVIVIGAILIISARTGKMPSTQQLIIKSPEEYGEKYREHLLEQYKLYVKIADKLDERKQFASKSFIIFNSILISVFGILSGIESMAKQHLWQYLIPIAGILVSMIWATFINSCRQLISVKFGLIHKVESELPVALFKSEWKNLGEGKTWQYLLFNYIEQYIPWIFIGTYIILIVVTLWNFSN